MKCSLCGYEFNEKVAEESCKGCPVKKWCKLIKCQNCGFETPPEPGWLKYLKRGRSK